MSIPGDLVKLSLGTGGCRGGCKACLGGGRDCLTRVDPRGTLTTQTRSPSAHQDHTKKNNLAEGGGRGITRLLWRTTIAWFRPLVNLPGKRVGGGHVRESVGVV